MRRSVKVAVAVAFLASVAAFALLIYVALYLAGR